MTETGRPEISVVMPAYNHEMYVDEAIESVLSQTFKDFELVIVNDGSTDGTEAVIKRYDDPRIRYYYQENGGSHDAINKGISLSRGDYVAIINSDDAFYCDRLEVLLNTAKTEGLDFVVSAVTLIDGNSNIISDPAHIWIKWYEKLKTAYRENESPLKAIMVGNYTISTSNFFVKRTLFDEIGTLSNLRYVLDYDFAIRAMKRDESKFRFLVESEHLLYRLHGKNTILSDTVSAHLEAYELISEAVKHIFGKEIIPSVDHLKEMTYCIRSLSGGYENFASQLLTERYIIRNSFSHKLGKLLTLRTFKEKKGKTVKDVQSLKAGIELFIDDVDVVSFDLFDTVFDRHIEPPERVKALVSELISKYLRDTYGKELAAIDILLIRNEVETNLRNFNATHGEDYECSYKSVVRAMSEKILGRLDEDFVKQVIVFEIITENQAIYVKDGMMDLIKWIKSRGKKMIAISDMYLDKDILWEIIRLKSLAGLFSSLYVSSERALNKISGNLFKHVMFSEKTLPERILHIGDHKEADYKVPVSLGFKAIRFYDLKQHKKKHILKTYNTLANNNIYWCGRYLLQLVKPSRETTESSFFYHYGYTLLGPLYALFVYGVIEAVKRFHLKKLFFIAREGDLFLEIYNRLAGNFFKKDELPEALYVYITRKTTALPSIYKGLTKEKAWMTFHKPQKEGLQSLFDVYGLHESEFEEIALKSGFLSLQEPVREKDNWCLTVMLKDQRFQKLVKKKARKERHMLRDYLRQTGFFGSKSVAFIDIGWSGSIQKFLDDTFGNRPDYPHLYGLYFGFSNGARYVFNSAKNTIVGVLFDDRYSSPVERIFSRFEELFEEGARALHATVTGYKNNPHTKEIEPIYKDDSDRAREIELQHNSDISDIRRGVLDFTEEFRKALVLTNYTFSELKPFFMTMAERAVAFPKKDEIKELFSIKHAEDFGRKNITDLSGCMIEKKSVLLSPAAFKRIVKDSMWRYGTAKSLGIPGMNVFFRLLDIVRGI
ncbi:MAG: glycosyltransferase [Nitrospirae bacterium YQR-1]